MSIGRKRSKAIQEAIDQLNKILSENKVYVDDKYVNAASPNGKAFKHGIVTALEILLHRTDTYKGFAYTGDNNIDHLWERKYF